MSGYPFIIQGSNIVVVIDNKTHTVSKTHITYQKVLDAIKANDWKTVKSVIEPAKAVVSYGKGNITVQDGALLWKGVPAHGYLAGKIIDMLQQGLPIEPLVNFMHNLMSNPSKRSIDELYGFLEKGGMPITPDGHFLAYKKVRLDFKDVHSGTMDNSVGKVVSMERNAVDDDKDRTCSAGLHFCSRSYLNSFGGDRIVIVKINPADVVSIPSDYNDAKGRACRYEVIGELNEEGRSAPEKAFTSPVQRNAAASVEVKGGVWPFPTVDEGPKTGDSEFYYGYTVGYTNPKYHGTGSQDYCEGIAKGQNDQQAGIPARYQYVGTKAVTAQKMSVPWPRIQGGIPQEFDKNGNALSMTKDAIRKRRARAAKSRNGGWPSGI